MLNASSHRQGVTPYVSLQIRQLNIADERYFDVLEFQERPKVEVAMNILDLLREAFLASWAKVCQLH